jgi:hypothetical protein
MVYNNNNQESRATEHFDFGYGAGDLQLSSNSKRSIRDEVNNREFNPEVVIDAFERAKGIKKKSKGSELAEYVFKNIILDPEQQKDQDMLNELMNNKRYMITLWKDTWTNQGNYRVFIIYGAKKEKEEDNQK